MGRHYYILHTGDWDVSCQMWPAVLHLISGLMMEMPGTKLMVVTGDSIGLVGVTECVGGGGGMSVISLCTWEIKKTCDSQRQRDRETDQGSRYSLSIFYHWP